jgi:hypothetical protein
MSSPWLAASVSSFFCRSAGAALIRSTIRCATEASTSSRDWRSGMAPAFTGLSIIWTEERPRGPSCFTTGRRESSSTRCRPASFSSSNPARQSHPSRRRCRTVIRGGAPERNAPGRRRHQRRQRRQRSAARQESRSMPATGRRCHLRTWRSDVTLLGHRKIAAINRIAASWRIQDLLPAGSLSRATDHPLEAIEIGNQVELGY